MQAASGSTNTQQQQNSILLQRVEWFISWQNYLAWVPAVVYLLPCLCCCIFDPMLKNSLIVNSIVYGVSFCLCWVIVDVGMKCTRMQLEGIVWSEHFASVCESILSDIRSIYPSLCSVSENTVVHIFQMQTWLKELVRVWVWRKRARTPPRALLVVNTKKL